MKSHLLILVVLLGMQASAQASIFYQGTGVSGDIQMGTMQNTTIVDGNPAYVIANTMTFSGLGASLSSLTITLNLTGGNNNGLFAYLVSPNDTTVVLINRPGYAVDGFGAVGAGMHITLTDSYTSQGSIQSEISASVLSGTYNTAGSLSGFNGGNPNGSWTLYFGDTIAGGGDATLNGWNLDITAVPEPINVALGIFGAYFILVGAIHTCRGLRKATLRPLPLGVRNNARTS